MNPSLLLKPLDLTKAVYFRNFSLTFLETLASIKMTISGWIPFRISFNFSFQLNPLYSHNNFESFCVSFLPLRIFFLVLAAILFNEWGFSQTAVVELTWAVQWMNVIVVVAVVQTVCSDSSEQHGLTGYIGSTLDVLVKLLGFSVAGSDWGTLLLRGFALCFGLVRPSSAKKK